YEALREWLERAKIALERLYELFVEAVARIVGWVDEHRAWLFLAAAAVAGVVTWAFAHDVLGSIELEKLAEATSIAPIFGFVEKASARSERVKMEVVEKWLRRGEPLLKRTAGLYDDVKEGKAALGELRKLGGAERAAAVLVAHAFRKAVEVYIEEVKKAAKVNQVEGAEAAEIHQERELETAEARFRQELNAVRKGLEKIRGGEAEEGFIQKILDQLNVDGGRVNDLAYGSRSEVRELTGASAAEKALAALYVLEGGGAYTRAVAGALHIGSFTELLETEPKTAYERYYEKQRSTVKNLIEKVKAEAALAKGFAEGKLQKELERAVAEATIEEDAKRRIKEILQSLLKEVKQTEINVPAIAGLLATDLTFEKENYVIKLSTTHLGMAELFVKTVGLNRINIDHPGSRRNPRPQMTLRAEPPAELFQQYGRVLRWLAEEGGWGQLKTLVEKGVKLLKEGATGKGRRELEKSDPGKVAAEAVGVLKSAYEKAAARVGGMLLNVDPDKYWAKVAEKMVYTNAPLARFFLSWLSAYLWAAEGKAKAVADFL
ncbi:MAG: hypothetical protein ACPL3C_10545, partial [Pyrobaculum sp.]